MPDWAREWFYRMLRIFAVSWHQTSPYHESPMRILPGHLHRPVWEKKKNQYRPTITLGLQILQYEFLGPVPMDQWGPPMEKLLYLVLARDKDRFNILYVGDCEKTDEKAFFVQHDRFKCWMQHAASEESLYLAVLPMFDSDRPHRLGVLDRILSHYKPPCNAGSSTATASQSPGYAVRKSAVPKPEGHKCPCCGSEMRPEKTLRTSTLYRCTGCGMSDTRVNS